MFLKAAHICHVHNRFPATGFPLSLLSFCLSFRICHTHSKFLFHHCLFPIFLRRSSIYTITLYGRLPIGLSAPLEASVTLLEATTPVKLPAKQCPLIQELETKRAKVSISTSAPRRLASPLRSLLTILHIARPVTVLSCSKVRNPVGVRGDRISEKYQMIMKPSRINDDI